MRADPGQIEQVVMNLAVNARDAMPRRRDDARLETAQRRSSTRRSPAGTRGCGPANTSSCRVTDTGIGMDEAAVAALRALLHHQAKGKGTGLGLSTVYGIVKQSEGYIWADSEPGKGACFRIYLPRVQAEAEKASEKPVVDSVRGTETVLVVEDEPEVRSLVERVLKSHGYRVLVADRPSEALTISSKPEVRLDLMVTDVIMPEMNGCELARRLQPFRPEMPILFLSGYTDQAIARQGILNPGIALLEKPFRPRDLAARVREALDSRSVCKAG